MRDVRGVQIDMGDTVVHAAPGGRLVQSVVNALEPPPAGGRLGIGNVRFTSGFHTTNERVAVVVKGHPPEMSEARLRELNHDTGFTLPAGVDDFEDLARKMAEALYQHTMEGHEDHRPFEELLVAQDRVWIERGRAAARVLLERAEEAA